MINAVLLSVACQKKCPVCPDPVPATATNHIKNPIVSISTLANTDYTFQGKKYIIDSYIANYSTDTVGNYGTATSLYTSAWTYSGSDVEIYAMIRFDYSSLPTNAIIKSAFLTLYADTTDVLPVNNGHYGNGVDSSVISNITSTWSELGVTWDNRPSSTALNQVKIKPTITSNDSLYIDVTNLVKDQLNTTNYGFQLALLDFTPYQRLYFYSSDEPTYINLIPKLVIKLQ